MPVPLRVFSALPFVVLTVACEDPECPPDHIRLGTTCRLAVRQDAEATKTKDSDAGDGGVALDGGAAGDGGAADEPDAGEPAVCPGVCEAGDEVACTTSCGSTGTGQCSEQCGAPSAEQCTPPAEVCNWVDDDCDGLADPGMLAPSPTRTRVWTQAGAPEDQGADTYLFSRPGGGAWLVYGAAWPFAGNVSAPLGVRLGQLDQHGQSGLAVSAPPVLATISRFVADADQKHVVIAATHHEGGGTFLRIHLLKASDLTLVNSFTAMSTNEPCARIVPTRVAVLSGASDDVQVAFARSAWTTAAPGTAQCDSAQFPTMTTDVFASSYTDGQWTPPTRALAVGTSALAPHSVLLEGLPCRSEFAVVFPAPSPSDPSKRTMQLSRLSPAGAVLGSTPLLSTSTTGLAESFVADIRAQDTCQGRDRLFMASPFAGMPGNTVEFETHLFAMDFDEVTGHPALSSWSAILRPTQPVLWPVLALDQSSLWVVGHDNTRTPRAFRVSTSGAAAAEEVRLTTFALPLPAAAPGEVLYAGGLGLGSGYRRIAGAPTGGAVALAESVFETAAGNPLRAPGDRTANAIAATYAAGCP